ncbi:MAG: DNA repair protein RadC [Vicingaceae bacterium]
MGSEKLNIKSWDEQDRPREKLLTKGRQHLSNAELIAILIGSGNKNETAVELAQKILNHSNNNLNELSKLSVNDLMKFKGIGEAKAISIIAALELGRRRKASETTLTPQIKSSKDAFLEMESTFMDLPHEEFWCMYLDRANKVINKKNIGKGGVSGTVADVKLILKHAIDSLASSIILFHNHPSGNLTPSQQDILLTKKINEAAKTLDISVLDHLIIYDTKYISLKDQGIF